MKLKVWIDGKGWLEENNKTTPVVIWRDGVYEVAIETSDREMLGAKFTICPSVGMLDSDGNEIFEGDIIVVTNAAGERMTGEIVDYRGGYWLKTKDVMYPVMFVAKMLENDGLSADVVGTVFENRELLYGQGGNDDNNERVLVEQRMLFRDG